MSQILRKIETPYVDAQTLLPLLGEYRKPREWIRRMVDKGELIRLKNGLYLIQEKIQRGDEQIIPYEQIANILYGPSYVSLEWALSFYGMIPERVYTVTSVTLGKAKEFRTTIGTFTYRPLYSSIYSLSIELKKAINFVGNFFIATPEKALLDLVILNCRSMNKEQLQSTLYESWRLEKTDLDNLNKKIIQNINSFQNSQIINHLIEII